MKRLLSTLPGAEEAMQGEEYEKRVAAIAVEITAGASAIEPTEFSAIDAEAEARFPGPIGLADVLDFVDFAKIERRVAGHVLDFNRRYGLDEWDYAIAGAAGLFAAMLDLLCVRAPPKPTAAWTKQVDGTFNKAVQAAFNKLIPPELSATLSKANPIGAPDSSTVADLIGAPAKALNPINHRLRSLAHDPVLGFIFGVLDMKDGTCTTVVDGMFHRIPSTKGATEGSVFQLLGRMLGHLLSDVNAPTANGNRGMGLPAPFMGLLRMFEGIPVDGSTLGRQVEWMFANGYDFRQFTVSSVPMAIMEVLMRAFYVVKQMKLKDADFGATVLETMPGRMHPRFRTMLALAYGTSSAVNAGKVCITKNLLDANYASWLGLVWNGFHAVKWALHDRPAQLWGELEAQEIAELQELVNELDVLKAKAAQLPT
ncbi:MAG: hypothetical protein P4L52_02720 [Acidocella sp.]|nr:hypothetical protein [Acidocella sp.]